MRLLIPRSDPRKANRGTAGDGEISEEGWRWRLLLEEEKEVGGGVGVDDRRPATVSAARDIGRRAQGASRFCPLPLMTEPPKAKLGVDGIGHWRNKISDIIARTAGSSSQSQPDPSQGTDVLTVDSCPRRRTPASSTDVRRLSLISRSLSPSPSPSLNPSESSVLCLGGSAHVVMISLFRPWESGLKNELFWIENRAGAELGWGTGGDFKGRGGNSVRPSVTSALHNTVAYII